MQQQSTVNSIPRVEGHHQSNALGEATVSVPRRPKLHENNSTSVPIFCPVQSFRLPWCCSPLCLLRYVESSGSADCRRIDAQQPPQITPQLIETFSSPGGSHRWNLFPDAVIFSLRLRCVIMNTNPTASLDKCLPIHACCVSCCLSVSLPVWQIPRVTSTYESFRYGVSTSNSLAMQSVGAATGAAAFVNQQTPPSTPSPTFPAGSSPYPLKWCGGGGTTNVSVGYTTYADLTARSLGTAPSFN